MNDTITAINTVESLFAAIEVNQEVLFTSDMQQELFSCLSLLPDSSAYFDHYFQIANPDGDCTVILRMKEVRLMTQLAHAYFKLASDIEVSVERFHDRIDELTPEEVIMDLEEVQQKAHDHGRTVLARASAAREEGLRLVRLLGRGHRFTERLAREIEVPQDLASLQ